MPSIVKILLGLVVAVPLVGLGAAYCAAGLGQQRIAGYETSAIGSLRAIVSAQMVYAAECNGGYAPTLDLLASRGLLTASLGGDPAVHQGYRFTLHPASGAQAVPAVSPSCEGAVTGFIVRAVPTDPGTTGVRFFSVDDSGDVMQATTASFDDATPLVMSAS